MIAGFHNLSIKKIRLTNLYILCEADKKLSLLISMLKQNERKKVMVYFLTCACVAYFHHILCHLKCCEGLILWELHGKFEQSKRSSK
jgi:ATP-dependent RNA helicase DDX55/SPB4